MAEWDPPCKFAVDGKVRIMKVVDKDGKSYNGFQWPKSGEVNPETWSEEATCESGGLFGWAWGMAFGDGKDPQFTDAIWIVFECDIEDTVHLNGKCKAKQGNVIHYGTYEQALHLIIGGQKKYIQKVCEGSPNNATGNWSASSATGNRSASSATGNWSASSATGNRSASSATGNCSASSATGNWSIACTTGELSQVECGETGLAVTTAKNAFWLVRKGSVFVQRTDKGVFVLHAEEKYYDQKVNVIDGVIKPTN